MSLNVLDSDPRSPSTEITRTPIFVSSKISKSETLLHDKSKENVRKLAMCTNAYKMMTQDNCRKDNTPKLIETSTKIVKQTEKRKSFVGLLETNLDFYETDIDKAMEKLQTNEERDEYKTDPKSPTTDFLKTPTQTDKNIDEVDINDEILPDIAVECTPCKVIEPVDLLQNILVEEGTNELSIADTVEDVHNEMPETKLLNNEVSTRKPLAECNANLTAKNSKLKVNDRPTKRKSRIPVYKNKVIQGKLQTCENTPPQKVLSAKDRPKPEWDANNKSIII